MLPIFEILHRAGLCEPPHRGLPYFTTEAYNQLGIRNGHQLDGALQVKIIEEVKALVRVMIKAREMGVKPLNDTYVFRLADELVNKYSAFQPEDADIPGKLRDNLIARIDYAIGERILVTSESIPVAGGTVRVCALKPKGDEPAQIKIYLTGEHPGRVFPGMGSRREILKKDSLLPEDYYATGPYASKEKVMEISTYATTEQNQRADVTEIVRELLNSKADQRLNRTGDHRYVDVKLHSFFSDLYNTKGHNWEQMLKTAPVTGAVGR